MEKFSVDLLITNAKVFNVYRRMFMDWDVAVKDGKIFYCGKETDALDPAEVIDAAGKWLVPGLIDIHMHIESSMITPQAFAWAIARDGVTTIVSEPHEIANVAGARGIQAMMDHLAVAGEAGGIVDILYAIPSSVPATDLETTGGRIDAAETAALMRNPNVVCLGEVMNFHDTVSADETRTRRIIHTVKALDESMPIEGHCPRILGLDLARMLYAGVDSDHCDQTAERTMARVEQGMFVEIQYKSLLPEVIECVEKNGLQEHCCLVTDDTMPDMLLTEGQLSRVYRKAVETGLSVENALYMATYTPARRMRLVDRGAVAPGKLADFVLLDDPARFTVNAVYKNGKCIHSTANPLQEPTVTPFPQDFYNSVKLSPLCDADFSPRVDAPDGDATFRLIIRSDKLTMVEEGTVTLPVASGEIAWEGSGTALLACFERYGKGGGRAYGFVSGTGIKRGAMASTLSHDHHNLMVMGHNKADMVLAANLLIEKQGGYVVVENGKLLAFAPLTIGGILSPKPLSGAAADLAAVRAAMETLGETHVNPLMAFSVLGLAVSPNLKLTDKGLVRVREGRLVSLLADK
ncbi:amidohydrolase family protein [Desulfovibrio sp. OttesenSCG-928-I05]|nr:amidohydrolase family protein [Desulfovibrio sp. OttesenSCG-928-I05]